MVKISAILSEGDIFYIFTLSSVCSFELLCLRAKTVIIWKTGLLLSKLARLSRDGVYGFKI